MSNLTIFRLPRWFLYVNSPVESRLRQSHQSEIRSFGSTSSFFRQRCRPDRRKRRRRRSGREIRLAADKVAQAARFAVGDSGKPAAARQRLARCDRG